MCVHVYKQTRYKDKIVFNFIENILYIWLIDPR